MRHTPDASAPLWTTSRSARELNTSESNTRKLADSGRLPHVRAENGQRLYRPADVQRLARERASERETKEHETR